MILLFILNILISQADSLLLKTGEAGDFANAVSMTSDGKGMIYVLDSDANEIIKLDGSLKIEKRAGRKGWSNGEFDSPTSIDGSSGLDIYVSDGRNYRLQRFDLNLGYVGTILTEYETYPENLKFKTPLSSVYVNPYIYVIDGENNRVVAYQSLYQNTAVPVFSFGGFQSAQKPLVNPTKIIKDGYNNIYILDRKQNAVLRYDNFGNYMSIIESQTVYSIAVYNNLLYILDGNKLLVYEAKRSGFTGSILFAEKIETEKIKDILVLNSGKFYLLEKNKISEYSLK